MGKGEGVKRKTTSLLNNISFLCVAAAVILIMAVILFATRSNLFAVHDVRVEGLQLINEDEITSLIGDVPGENLFLIDTNDLTYRVQLHPSVEKVGFERRLPHTLVLKVTERSPLAMVLTDEQLFLVDRSGMILDCFDIWPDIQYPVLTGIEVQKSSGKGQKIKDEALTKALNCFADAPADLKMHIDEIHLESMGAVRIYLDTRVEVKLGISDNYAGKLEWLAEMVKSDALAQSVHYSLIDMTSSKTVIK